MRVFRFKMKKKNVFVFALNEKFMVKKNGEKWEILKKIVDDTFVDVNCVVECNWIIIMKTKVDILCFA